MTEMPELPARLALAWGVAERPERVPRRELSIERIVEAAVEIADADGLAGVSMARVAKSLGFTTMSLYRYVTSKDDLLLLMQEMAITAEFPPAHEPADWRAELREWVLLVLAIYQRHTWALDIPITGAPLTPNNLRIVDVGLRALRSTSLEDGEKMAAILLCTGYARNQALLGRDLERAANLPQDERARNAAQHPEILRHLVDDIRFPYLRPLVERGSYVTEEEHVDEIDDIGWGLERVLDGLAAIITRRVADRDPSHGTGTDSGISAETGSEETAARIGSTQELGSTQERATADALAVVRTYASDPKVRKAAAKRKEAEKRVREAQKKVREAEKKVHELEKATQVLLNAEAEAARAAADHAAGERKKLRE